MLQIVTVIVFFSWQICYRNFLLLVFTLFFLQICYGNCWTAAYFYLILFLQKRTRFFFKEKRTWFLSQMGEKVHVIFFLIRKGTCYFFWKKKDTCYCYLKSIVQVPLSIIYLFSLFFSKNSHIILSKRIIIAVIINNTFLNCSFISFIKKKGFHCYV